MTNNVLDSVKDISFTPVENNKLNTLLDILVDMNLSYDSKLSGVMYFSYVCGYLSLDEIKIRSNETVFSNVSILIKLDGLNYSQQDTEAENLRKMFFVITKDIRIIMLKIAYAVMKLRFVVELDDGNAKQFAHSILDLYAPLSARLGLSKYKTELENGAFKLLNPEIFNEIQTEVDNRFHKRQPIVDRLTLLVKSCMDDLGIKGKVYGRKKHIYSIYKKLASHDLNHIYDLIAVRAIVNNVSDCYALLGKLSSVTEPIPNRFKDYISTPKPNGYQSLHTTVKFEGFPVEIQIRTEDMHKYAEYGIAAHWMYKEKRSKQDNLDIHLAWLRQMIDADNISIDELANSLNLDIYNGEIFVQSPKGKVVYLPSGSTPIDFAYAIHSEVGNKCVGAKINGKMSPVNTILSNGDVVEIVTNVNSKGPSRDWLKICKTSEAKSKINSFFKKNIKDETIKIGKSMLENTIKEKGYSVSRLVTKQATDEILKYYNMSNVDELYANIGTNAISPKYLTNKLVSIFQKQQKDEQIEANHETLTISAPNDNMVSIKNLNNVLINFAKCCTPMYGDDIIGFVSTGRGIIIHRKICPNVAYFDLSRLIEANWKPIKQVPRKTRSKKVNSQAKPLDKN